MVLKIIRVLWTKVASAVEGVKTTIVEWGGGGGYVSSILSYANVLCKRIVSDVIEIFNI